MKGKNLSIFQHPIELFSRFSPDIRKLSFSSKPDPMFSKFFTSRIFRWQNLQTISCIKVALDADALAHLSSIPALTELTCTVSAALADQVTPSYSPLLFSNMNLSSFLSTLDTSDIADTIEELHMNQVGSLEDTYVTEDRKPILALKDLQPFMALSKLRHFSINIEWNVDHSNNDLLTVTSAWPRLELLHINHNWAWNMPGGITPDGLLQFLQQCPSLHCMSLAVDTRNPTEDPPLFQGLTLPPKLTINILDSTLEQESVQAIATFFTDITSHTFSSDQTNWLGRLFWIQVEMHLANNIREHSGPPSGSTSSESDESSHIVT
ncbi:hypothetical protein JVT61DRAFT_14005 [Boletus reticuloceps]|uniref:Uncharacterized protein n=1 Tax=Boletus reticuloceps TaxID=495285 RepID=A0A8I3ADC0_9AGAM|nr:hypothetical protein JVT61DRAFT_14005 [Boletus reticuloceps]